MSQACHALTLSFLFPSPVLPVLLALNDGIDHHRSYIANRVTDKLTRITDNVYCCRSGSAADTQAVADMVSYYLDLHSVQIGENPLVSTAASVFKKICYENRDSLSAGIICAGWDKKNGGQVYSIPLGGLLKRQPFSIGGSGSTYVYGLVDKTFKEGMTKEECMEFTKNSEFLLKPLSTPRCIAMPHTRSHNALICRTRGLTWSVPLPSFILLHHPALALAMARDGSSGGVIRLACIDKDGIDRQTFKGDEIPSFFQG